MPFQLKLLWIKNGTEILRHTDSLSTDELDNLIKKKLFT